MINFFASIRNCVLIENLVFDRVQLSWVNKFLVRWNWNFTIEKFNVREERRRWARYFENIERRKSEHTRQAHEHWYRLKNSFRWDHKIELAPSKISFVRKQKEEKQKIISHGKVFALNRQLGRIRWLAWYAMFIRADRRQGDALQTKRNSTFSLVFFFFFQLTFAVPFLAKANIKKIIGKEYKTFALKLFVYFLTIFWWRALCWIRWIRNLLMPKMKFRKNTKKCKFRWCQPILSKQKPPKLKHSICEFFNGLLFAVYVKKDFANKMRSRPNNSQQLIRNRLKIWRSRMCASEMQIYWK